MLIKSLITPRSLTVAKKFMQQIYPEKTGGLANYDIRFTNNTNTVEVKDERLALFIVNNYDNICIVNESGHNLSIKDDLDVIETFFEENCKDHNGYGTVNDIRKIALRYGIENKNTLGKSIDQLKLMIREERFKGTHFMTEREFEEQKKRVKQKSLERLKELTKEKQARRRNDKLQSK